MVWRERDVAVSIGGGCSALAVAKADCFLFDSFVFMYRCLGSLACTFPCPS